MAKRKMKNRERDLSRLMEDRTLLVEAALEAELTTKEDICKATEITRLQLNELFRKNGELYAKYCVLRKLLVETASDNISAIVSDRGHPKNYDASKWVVTNYKSDLDSVLEVKDDSADIEVDVNGSGRSGASPITIRFGKKKKEDEVD